MEELGSYTVRARRQLHSSACCIDRVRAATVGAHLQDDNTINKIHHTRATPLAPDVSHVGREGHPDPEMIVPNVVPRPPALMTQYNIEFGGYTLRV